MKGDDVMIKKYHVRAFGFEETVEADSSKEAACKIAHKHGYFRINRKYTKIGYGIEISVYRYDKAGHNRAYFYQINS